MRGWVYDPHSGGVKIPKPVQERTRQRILAHAEKNYAGKFNRIDVRFRGALCYIDAYVEPDLPQDFDEKLFGKTREQRLEEMRTFPLHLCRLRYFNDEEKWTLAFYTYSHDRYEPSVFDNGTFHGTPEEAFDVGAVYLEDR